MRDTIRHSINRARRSGDRIGVGNTQDRPPSLGAEVIRLARLATSIHMAENVRLMIEHEAADHALNRASASRETLG